MRMSNEIIVSSLAYMSVMYILKSNGSGYWWLGLVLMVLHGWDIWRDWRADLYA